MRFPCLGFRATVPQEDLALKVAYPAAHIINAFRGRQDRPALGCAGPTNKVVSQFDGIKRIAVNPGFARKSVTDCSRSRLVLADLTGIHQQNNCKPDPFSGHHSDIFRSEVYDLIAGLCSEYEVLAPYKAGILITTTQF